MEVRIVEYNKEFFVDAEIEKGVWKNLYVAKTREEALDMKAKWLRRLTQLSSD